MNSDHFGQRSRICGLLIDVGPDAPTLLEGWDARMLAAHLVIRERRPLAAAGILIPLLAGYTARVQHRVATSPWEELVGKVRTGPPAWHPFSWPIARRQAAAADLLEYFVHGEDVRRAQPGADRYTATPEFQDALWRRLRGIARLLYRRHPCAVVLRRENGETIAAGKHAEVGSAGTVTVSGVPSELLLHAFGRDRRDASVTQVEVIGDEMALQAYTALGRGL